MIPIVAALMIGFIVFAAVYWLGQDALDRIERGEEVARADGAR